MRILIVEDEKFATERLEKMLLESDPTLTIAGKTGSIRETARWLVRHEVDLIFLDIQLSDGISFSIFDQVPVNTPVIFTTAFDQYAIRAFQLNSIAYLLKPIKRKELKESLEKFRKLKSAFAIDFEDLLAQMQGREASYKKRFMVQIGEKIRKIEVPDVAYFYTMEKAIYLRTFEGNSYPLEYTLDKLEDLLHPEHFFRINRKFIVSMKSIASMTAYSRSRVKLSLTPVPEGDPETIVSIDRSGDFKKWLNN